MHISVSATSAMLRLILVCYSTALRYSTVIHPTRILGYSVTSSGISAEPLLQHPSSTYSEYSTTVIRSHSPQGTITAPPSLSSILTIRPNPPPNPNISTSQELSSTVAAVPHQTQSEIYNVDSLISIETYHTAHSSIVSTAAATEGGSTIRSLPMIHRFTLIKPGAKRPTAATTVNGSEAGNKSRSASPLRTVEAGWNPLDLFFSSALLVTKCDVCMKRLGWKPVLECDDCGLKLVFIC